MKIPPVKGTRDFYPPQMAVRNFIVDGWKQASLRNGFEEYDGFRIAQNVSDKERQ
ncbi:MAG: hypothetical protein ACYTBS_16430 [Planctomycetota bacterium]|jgi:histidyl-tRNA synthetase